MAAPTEVAPPPPHAPEASAALPAAVAVASAKANGAGAVAAAGRVITIMLHKADLNAKLGVVLTGVKGHPPIIKELKPGGIGADADMLKPGVQLLAINGAECFGHEEATRLL
jgi:hypothetical protein